MQFKVGRSRLPELLAARNWTQRHLSERSGVNEKTISRYITERSKDMPLSVAIAVADALGVHPRELCEWLRK